MKNVIVILSGGMDSSVLLLHHLHLGDKVRALTVDYGQRHVKEIEYARNLCEGLGVPHYFVDLSSVGHLFTGSSQTDLTVAVPMGRYDEESMKATVVPNRNMILLSVALGLAVTHKADGVSYGAHAGDHAIYPDCRDEFVAALNEAAKLCDWHPVQIYRPFIDKTKAQLVALGTELGLEFRNTWSCYVGRNQHCGTCGTCIERREAFHLAGVVDPTDYHPSAPSVEYLVAHDWQPKVV